MKGVVIVTGASSGIGREIAVYFANLDYKVLAVGRNEIGLLHTRMQAVHPFFIIPIVADLSIKQSVDEIIKYLGTVDKVEYVIHCAATSEPLSPLSQTTDEQITQSMNVNVVTPLLLTTRLLPFYHAKARVLFTGSDYIGSIKMRPNLTGTYGMAKSALDVVVAYLKQELTVPIGYFNPGTTNTPLYKTIITAAGLFGKSPQGADPKKVAEFVGKVMSTTTDTEFKTQKWDYRDSSQQKMLMDQNESLVQAKL